jgi:hypothetical protein
MKLRCSLQSGSRNGCLSTCGLNDSPGTFEEVTLSEEDAFHIFVVDDEKAIAETLAIILGKSGFVATSFTNPLEALEKASMKSPGLLLSDVVMPVLANFGGYGCRSDNSAREGSELFSCLPLVQCLLPNARGQAP